MTANVVPNADLLSSFLIESVVDSLILYLSALLAFRFLKIGDASLRGRFMLLPLVTPVLLGAAFHWLVQPTEALVLFKPADGIIHYLASPLRGIGDGVLIIYGAAVILGGWRLLQGLTAPLLLEWRWHHPRRGDDSFRSRCQQVLESLSTRTTWRKCRVVFSRTGGFYALAFPCSPVYVVVQPALARLLDHEELRAVLAHEEAHVRQEHSLLSFMAGLCVSLMWFNPVAHLAYQRFLQYQEEAADDGAVALSGNPRALAASLVKGWRFRHGQSLAIETALLGGGQGLERRILRLVHYHAPTRIPHHDTVFLVLTLTTTLLFALAW